MTRSTRCDPRLGALAVSAALSLLAPTAARAEPPPADEPDPVAVALFRRGRELLAQGDWEGGCARMAQSYERTPSPGTLLNLARCDEHRGKLASAWARYQQAIPLAERSADPARRDELLALARGGVRALEPRLPRLRIHARREYAGLVVVGPRGAFPLEDDVPGDPGVLRLTARAPGYREAVLEIELVEGRSTVVEVTLEPLPTPPAAEAPRSPARAPAPVVPPSVRAAGPALPWAALGLGAAGLVIGGVAVGFGLDAAHARSALEDRCGPELRCTDPAFDPADLNARKNLGLGLAVGLGAASVALLGAALWVGLSTKPAARLTLLPTRTGLAIRF